MMLASIKMNTKLYLSLILCAIFSMLHGQTHQWVMPLGGDWFDFGHAVFADDSGYVYSTGQFSTTTDFDPRASRLFNINSNGFYDIYVHKADSTGHLVWAKGMGSNLHDSGESIVVDDSGNVYTVGYFFNTVDFDPGPGTFNLTSNGVQDLFVQKLNRFGDFEWAISIGGNQNDFAHNVLMADSSHLIVTGSFMGSVDFDPDTSSFIVNASSNSDAFILKLNAAGEFVWVKSIDGISTQSGFASALDAQGNIYTTGFYRGTADFDPDTSLHLMTAVDNDDVFIQKMDPSGNFVWSKSIGGLGNERAESISVDAQGSAVICGHFSNRIDLNPDTSVVVNSSSSGDVDLFIMRLDPQGNYLWGTTMGAASRDRAESVVQDQYSNVYVIGQYGFTVDFNPSSSISNLTSTGSADVFILKLDAAGNFNWVNSIGSFDIDVGKGIAIDNNDNIYTTGYFQSQVDFDPSTNTDNKLAAGWNDIFVQKFGQLNNSVEIAEIEKKASLVSAFPNPFNDLVKVEFNEVVEAVELEIRDAAGRLLFHQHFDELKSTSIPIDQGKGLYFLNIKTKDSQSIIKLTKAQ